MSKKTEKTEKTKKIEKTEKTENYYHVLGIDHDCTKADIETAYRKLAINMASGQE